MAATETYVPRLKQVYEAEIRTALKDELGLATVMQVPRVAKITLNMGVGDAKTDAKALDPRSRNSRPSPASARRCGGRESRSRASSSARGWPSVPASRSAAPGCTSSSTGSCRSRCLGSVTSAGSIPGSFDGRGNYSLGIREQIIFPEIDYD